MNQKKKTGVGIIAILISISILIGVYVVGPDSSETVQANSADSPGLEGEVSIGLILPITGDLATHGEENWEGSKLGVIDFNEHLKDIGAGWHLKMVSEDSQTNPVIALEKLTSLHAKGIGVVVGPETSSNIRNVKGYADSNNMLLVSCCSSAPALAIPNDNVFRLVPDDRNQGAAIAKLMQHEGIDVLVPVWRGDTWGDGLSEATMNSFGNRGGMVDDGIRYNPESPEFSTSASLLAEKINNYVEQYGAENVGIAFLGFSEVLQFVQSSASHEILDDVRWFGPGSINKEYKLIDDPVGLEFSNSMQFTAVQVAASDSEKYQRVHDHLVETLGRAPNTFVHSSYDVVWIIGLSMLEAQSTDPHDIKPILPKIAENYSGSIGSTKLNEAGDLDQADYEVWGIRDGKWVLLGKYTASEDSVTLT